MMCHEDEATAIERGIDGGHFFGYSLAHYYVFGDHRPGRTNIWEEFQRAARRGRLRARHRRARRAPLGVKIMQEGLGSLRGAIGTPEQIRDLAGATRRPASTRSSSSRRPGNNRHEHICESLELFAAEVMPEFAERGREREAAKRERLAPAVEAALRAPRRRRAIADPGYTIEPTGLRPAARRGRADGERPRRRRAPALRAAPAEARRGGVLALRASCDDRRLERIVGSDPGLRVALRRDGAPLPSRQGRRLQRRHPIRAGAGGGGGEAVGREVNGPRALARPGRAPAPAVTIAMSPWPTSSDIVGRDLDPGKALLEGKLNVEGDFDVLTKLGEMFGEPAP